MKFKANKLLISTLILVLIGLVSCKNKDIDTDSFKIERERVVSSVDSISITGSYSFTGTVKEMTLNIGKKESLIDADIYDVHIEGTDFSVNVGGLTPNTEYYYRYAIDFGAGNTILTETKSFTTLESEAELPTVKTLDVLAITSDSTTFRIKCQVVSDGGLEVTERGICWNTYGDPTMDDETLQYNGDLNIFEAYTLRLENLTLATSYYVRAYAKNAAGTGLGEVLEFETPNPEERIFNIGLTCFPEDGGMVTGGGTFHYGDTTTLKAEPNEGYEFAGWNDGNTNNPRMVTVTDNATYTAVFSEVGTVYHNVSTHAQPDEGGRVDGGGPHVEGEQIQLSAIANTGYTFDHWVDGSIENPRTITVDDDMEFTAIFKKNTYTIKVSNNTGGTATIGDMPGTFQVTFEHGEICTVHATADEGYEFVNWKEGGIEVCLERDYDFEVTADRNLVANFSPLPVNEYTIRTEVIPDGAGTVTGDGTYNAGTSITLTAEAYDDYIFDHWQDGNIENPRQIIVTEDATYIAYFIETPVSQYTIATAVTPVGAGTITGDGTYNAGTSITLTAEAHQGYTFDHWQDSNTENPRDITVTEDATYVAYFITEQPQVPIGAINGVFTINSNGDKVYFSKGNLQYNAAQGTLQCADGTTKQGTWRFAQNQYDLIGSDNSNISQDYNGWIDLFGWGTSGFDHGAISYQPWSTSQTNSDYYAYGSSIYNLYNQSGRADWGVYNAINGGEAGRWRTLTGGGSDNSEWHYILFIRSASTVNGTPDARYAKATVADVQGVILFPDNYSHPSGVAQPVGINDTGVTGWNGNDYSTSEFGQMEQEGAVFLPAAGYRRGTLVNSVGSYGDYWSASCHENSSAHRLYFNGSYLVTDNAFSRCYGFSVRLVCPVEY